MTAGRLDVPSIEDPTAKLAESLIDEFLRARGWGRAELSALDAAQAKQLWKEAALYAAIKLAEIESRSHFVHEMHGAPRD